MTEIVKENLEATAEESTNETVETIMVKAEVIEENPNLVVEEDDESLLENAIEEFESIAEIIQENATAAYESITEAVVVEEDSETLESISEVIEEDATEALESTAEVLEEAPNSFISYFNWLFGISDGKTVEEKATTAEKPAAPRP